MVEPVVPLYLSAKLLDLLRRLLLRQLLSHAVRFSTSNGISRQDACEQPAAPQLHGVRPLVRGPTRAARA